MNSGDEEKKMGFHPRDDCLKGFEREKGMGLPGGPVIRTPCFHCFECGFDPWSGN